MLKLVLIYLFGLFLGLTLGPLVVGQLKYPDQAGEVWLVTTEGKVSLGKFVGKTELGPPAAWTNERGDTLTTRGVVLFQAHTKK